MDHLAAFKSRLLTSVSTRKQFPVSPEALALSECGFVINQLTSGHPDKQTLSSLSLDKNKEFPVLTIFKELEETRLNFLIAHAIGHYVHGHLNTQDIFVETLDHFKHGVRCSFEQEANNFALNFLLPKHELDYAIFKKNIPLEKIHIEFNVSDVLTIIQLRSLGYIK